MKNRFLSLFLAVGMGMVFAGDTAVFNLSEVLESSKTYIDAKNKIESQIKHEQDILDKIMKDIENIASKLEKNRTAMSKEDLEKESKILTDKQNEYTNKQMTFQRELQKANQEAMKKVYDKISAASAKVANKKNLQVIMPDAGVSYASINVTKEIKEALAEEK